MTKDGNTGYKNLKPDNKPVPVVAIGGSAGGQKAVSELLTHLPGKTGLAYVYIQHLSPERDSHLVSILSKVTSMSVQEAEPLMQVEPDHLYIIPPNKNLEIVDGVLVLTRRKPRPQIHLPIDQFFVSLSERQKDGAIGIVLSGMATDGTLGLQAIKVAGGITFAQDETAEFSSMPESAIREGVVDMVLSPKEIAHELVRLAKHADIFQLTNETDESSDDDTSDKDLDKILQFVKSTVGMDFAHYKKSTIRRRIMRRMLLYKLDELPEYINYLKQHPSEAATLYDDLLINVTRFFRDEQTMIHLKKAIIPSVIRAKPPGEPIRLWVAGCSTGQEAYSLAMILTEILGSRLTNTPIQIFATDLSEAAITKARLGIYTKSEVKEVGEQRLARFFTKTDEHYRINKPLRDLCVFAQHNLLSDPPFSRIDMVSCRNLLIYLDDVLQKKALATFHYALTPDGILLLGKSESVGTSSSHFIQIEKDYKVFSRKNNTLAKIPTLRGHREPNDAERTRSALRNNDILPADQLDKLVDSWLLNNFIPPSIIVDQDMEIIQFRGSTSLFLEPAPGKASLNLSKMARPGLVLELRNAIHKARKTSQPTGKEGLEIIVGGKQRYVDIKAIPLTNIANQQLFLILFEEAKEHPWHAGQISAEADNRALMLEAELTALRQDMHSIIEEQEASNEELQSANEEILSSNEELQSINEELETSKEEIESANEELQTINQELQLRNDQLTESYNYSEAILSTINEATLVVDEQLKIKVANRAFYKVFQARQENTEGRTIYELGNGQLDFEEFREMLHSLIHGGSTVSGYEVRIQIKAADDRVMRVHARRVLLNRRQTILLVFEDITEHRKAQKLIRERQRWFEELVDNSSALIWITQSDAKITYLNKAWLDFTGLSADDSATFVITDRIHPDDQDGYLETSTNSVREKIPYSVEYRLRNKDQEYEWLLENSKPMFSADGHFSGYIGTCTNIHLQKTLTEQLNRHVEERTGELKAANTGLETAIAALRRTADRLRSVLNGVPAAVMLMEPVFTAYGDVKDFTTSVYNEVVLDLVKIQASEITGRTLGEWLPELKEHGLFELYTQVMLTGTPIFHEVGNLSFAAAKTFAILITRQVDSSGIVVTVLDITNRKDAETSLLQTAENLQAVLDSSPASIGFFKAVYDKGRPYDFMLMVCNRKFSDAFAKDIQELTGALASGLYASARLEVMFEVLENGEEHYEEIFFETEQKWVGVSISGHDHGVAITELDISLLKNAQLEQDELINRLNGSYELIESLSALKEYVRHRGSILRSAFHDLRGSFGIISGAASLLNLMETEEDRRKNLDMIQRNMRQVSLMMNKLLDFARIESEPERVDSSPFNATELLRALGDAAKGAAKLKNLWVKTNIPDDLTVVGDEEKVRRVAQYLVDNALKHTRTGGLTISAGEKTDADHPNWHFSVEDTGPGIPAWLVDKIIEDPAIPEKNPPKSAPGHTTEQTSDVHDSIDFFVIKHLVALLGGRLTVTTGQQGTRFEVTLHNGS